MPQIDNDWTQQFTARGPWVTAFEIDGALRGGNYDPRFDERLTAFRTNYPNPGRVLDLGCLEGGFSIEIAKSAEEVVGIDSRPENLDRARWISEILRADRVSYLHADLEEFDFAGLGDFEVVFNVGLLYHLREPWKLLARLADRTQAMFLWTHVAARQAQTVERGGYRGIEYAEYGRDDPLSGMSEKSFWPTLAELRRMLRDAGFGRQKMLAVDGKHPHGPAVTMAVRVGTRPMFTWPWRSLSQRPRTVAAKGN